MSECSVKEAVGASLPGALGRISAFSLGGPLSIVVGDEIVSFPEIDFDEHPDGIPDAPSLRISAADRADARDLVRRLRGG